MPTDEHCNVNEYLNDDVPVCMEAEIDSWEADFLEQLGEEEQDEQQMDGEGPDEDDVVTPKLSNFKEAIQTMSRSFWKAEAILKKLLTLVQQ